MSKNTNTTTTTTTTKTVDPTKSAWLAAWEEIKAIRKETKEIRRLLEELLSWIKENGYEECVAGFEMCNEPFYGKDPEGFAAY